MKDALRERRHRAAGGRRIAAAVTAVVAMMFMLLPSHPSAIVPAAGGSFCVSPAENAGPSCCAAVPADCHSGKDHYPGPLPCCEFAAVAGCCFNSFGLQIHGLDGSVLVELYGMPAEAQSRIRNISYFIFKPPRLQSCSMVGSGFMKPDPTMCD
ncbi:MAG: hypothetical protein FWD88_01710 [Treponema sp.]|nr:hypothetical protein [Treponema sp.]